MSSLLFIYERDMPTISTMKDIFLHLNPDHGIRSHFILLWDVKPADIHGHEIIVFLRPNDVLSAAVAKRAAESGRFVITFCDDDLLHYNPMAYWRRSGLKKTLHYSNAIWSSSNFIGQDYKKHTVGKRFIKTDTIVRAEQIAEHTKSENDRVKIVYAANPGHLLLFNEYAKTAVCKLIGKYGNKISITFIGVKPDLSEYEGRTKIRYVKGMPLLEYREFMKKEKFDIGIAPLGDNRFTRCKYFNKYIEYSMSGVCGVYSKVIPYVEAVQDGINGLLAENTSESWLDKLETAVLDGKLRTNCILASQENLRENFIEESIIQNFKKQTPEAVEYNNEMNPCKGFYLSKIWYCFLRPADLVYLSFYYLRSGGIQVFLEKLKIHFRERKAYARKKVYRRPWM